MARGEILAFLDDDCVASPTWLVELVKTVKRDRSTIAGAPVVHPQPETASAAAGQVITELVDGFFNPPGETSRFMPGLNFALDRQKYQALGGCDPGFGFLAAEDRDFVDRWQQTGGRLELCTSTQVRHEHRSSLGGFVRQYFNYGRGAWHFHQLRRQRRREGIWTHARLHSELPIRLVEPIRQVSPRLRLKTILLIGVWQLSNLAGFLWQGYLECLIKLKRF